MRHFNLLFATLLTACCASTTGTQDTSSAQQVAGTKRTDEFHIAQVWVPPGEFTMGTDTLAGLDPPKWALREFVTEQPAHRVQLTHGYWLDQFEVTVEAFGAFILDGSYEKRALWSEAGWSWLQAHDDKPQPCGSEPDHPVACVSWYEAEAYAAWRGGRLPTDAEWEFAARGPDSRIYPWGNEWDATRANIVDSTETTAVGQYPLGTSWVGAHDMAGNVMEWVSDWLTADYYLDELMLDPTGADEGRIKIEKGGWWGSNPFVSRAAYHHFEDPPEYADHHIGFRIVTDPR